MVLSSSSAVSLVTLKADRSYWSHLPSVYLDWFFIWKPESWEAEEKQSSSHGLEQKCGLVYLKSRRWFCVSMGCAEIPSPWQGEGPWPNSVLWGGLWLPGPLVRTSLATSHVCISPAYLNSQLWGMQFLLRRKAAASISASAQAAPALQGRSWWS